MSEMSEESLRLDGNAAAGVLSEIFAVEMTSALCTCAHCGHVAPLGSLVLYGGQVGMVLRCPTCEQVQMRLVRIPERGGQYWIDMRGISILRITPGVSG
jgi:hypothetical protein